MEVSLLKTLGGIAGIGGIVVGVLLYVYRDVIRKDIFSRLTKQHSYQLFRLIVVLTWITAIVGILCWTVISVLEKSKSSFTELSVTPTLSITPLLVVPSPTIEKIVPTPKATIITRPIPPGFKQPSPAISTEIYEMIGHVILGMSEEATIQNSPVVGATIVIRNRQTNEEFPVTSDNDGKFSITLPVGSYKILATHNAYYDKSTTCTVNKRTQNTPCRIIFTLPKSEESPLGTIQGNVLDEEGRPIAGVHVKVKSKTAPDQTQDDHSTNYGSFQLQEVAHGEYYITFQREKFKTKTVECNTQKGSRCFLNVRLSKDDK